jgi:AraC-like DNA-binding protein/quercetin dioxygenase-like cupin family protein
MPETALAELDDATWASSESRSLSRRLHVAPLAELPELKMVQRIATCHAITGVLDTHSHDGLEITYVERGFLEWTTDAHTDELSGGDVLVTWAGEEHGPANGILAPCILHTLKIALWDTPQSGAGFLGVPMSESMLLVDALRNLPSRRFAAPPDLAARFTRLLDCLDEPGRLTAVRARAILLELLLTVVDASAGDGARERSALVERAIAMIDSHLDEPLEMTRVARNLGCSVSYLATRFRREVGIPPAQYHLRRRVHEAARRLRSADSITTVAFDFGFASSQHFTTAFKRVTGMAPRDYRVTQCRPRPIAC